MNVAAVAVAVAAVAAAAAAAAAAAVVDVVELLLNGAATGAARRPINLLRRAARLESRRGKPPSLLARSYANNSGLKPSSIRRLFASHVHSPCFIDVPSHWRRYSSTPVIALIRCETIFSTA